MYANPKEAEQFVMDQESAYATCKQSLGTRTFINRCMVEGIQWIGGGTEMANIGRTDRRPTNWNPDSSRIVATINRITKLIHQTSAASWIQRLELSVSPGDRDTGVEAAANAQVMESASNAMIDFTSYTEAARECSYRRCVDGTHALGWGIKVKQREMALRNGGVEQVDDQVLTAFTTSSMQFTLDPLNQQLDLDQHDFVIWSEVWPIEKLKRQLGINVDERYLQTCGELMGMEMYANSFSMNRLYANMALFSRTKGARVHQIHVKDASGRFSTMLVGVRVPNNKDMLWVNFDNQETPFGGSGMPFTLLHGYRRPDSMWSVSDVAMLKDDQDRLNFLNTQFLRMIQKNAGAQWLLSKGSVKGSDPDEFRTQFSNLVYGLIEYDPGTRDRPNPPPVLVKHPEPPNYIQEMSARYQEDMRDQVHRPEITAGATKTHVPNSTYISALEGANQVLGNRAGEDLARHEKSLKVGLGTVVKLAQEGSPFILGHLQRAGFDDQDFAALAQADPYCPCDLTIRESSVKFESKERKEQRLWQAVQLQAVPDPMKLRMALAGMDTPLDEDDKTFYTQAQKATTRILMGEEWQPFNLGDYTNMFVTQFQRAMFDRRAQSDPETRARIQRAIDSQTMLAMQMMQAQATAAEPVPPVEPEEEAAPAEPSPDVPDEADLATLLQAIESTATAQQPMAA